MKKGKPVACVGTTPVVRYLIERDVLPPNTTSVSIDIRLNEIVKVTYECCAHPDLVSRNLGKAILSEPAYRLKQLPRPYSRFALVLRLIAYALIGLVIGLFICRLMGCATLAQLDSLRAEVAGVHGEIGTINARIGGGVDTIMGVAAVLSVTLLALSYPVGRYFRHKLFTQKRGAAHDADKNRKDSRGEKAAPT